MLHADTALAAASQHSASGVRYHLSLIIPMLSVIPGLSQV